MIIFRDGMAQSQFHNSRSLARTLKPSKVVRRVFKKVFLQRATAVLLVFLLQRERSEKHCSHSIPVRMDFRDVTQRDSHTVLIWTDTEDLTSNTQ